MWGYKWNFDNMKQHDFKSAQPPLDEYYTQVVVQGYHLMHQGGLQMEF